MLRYRFSSSNNHRQVNVPWQYHMIWAKTSVIKHVNLGGITLALLAIFAARDTLDYANVWVTSFICLYHIHIWQVSPQLNCGDTCQIWIWLDGYEKRGNNGTAKIRCEPHPLFNSSFRTQWVPCIFTHWHSNQQIAANIYGSKWQNF